MIRPDIWALRGNVGLIRLDFWTLWENMGLRRLDFWTLGVIWIQIARLLDSWGNMRFR